MTWKKKVLQQNQGMVTSPTFSEIMTDRPTNQPTDQPTRMDRRTPIEVTLPKKMQATSIINGLY